MAKKNLKIKQGDTFEWLFLVKDINGDPLDMTTYTGGTAGLRGKIREQYSDVAAVVSFTCVLLNKTGVEAAIAAGTCHLSDVDIAALQLDAVGKCYGLVRLTATNTAALGIKTYVYALEIEATTGFVFTPYAGEIEILGEATK